MPCVNSSVSKVAKLSSPWLWKKQIQTEIGAGRHLQDTQATAEDLFQHRQVGGRVRAEATQALRPLAVQRPPG